MNTPVAIYLQLAPKAQEAVRRWTGPLPAEVLRAVAAAMDKENEHTVEHIVRDYLSFSRAQKPVPKGLRVVSNRLRGSTRASKATVTGDAVVSAIGSQAPYAELHEFGGAVTRTSKPGSVRLRVDAKGELIRQGNGRAIFARAYHTRVREVSFKGGRTYTANYPERAPFRRGIADCLSNYEAALSRAVLAILPT